MRKAFCLRTDDRSAAMRSICCANDRLTHHVHILEMNGDSYRLNKASNASGGCNPGERSACHGAPCGEGPVLAMLAVLRVALLLPSPTLRAVAREMPVGTGKLAH